MNQTPSLNQTPQFRSTYPPVSFQNRLEGLAAITLEARNNPVAVQLDREDYDYIMSALDSAAEAYRANDREEGWYYLTLAAQMIGNHEGAEVQRLYSSSGESAVEDHLRQFGRKGGLVSGEKFVALREKVVSALLEKTPEGGWPTKAAFDLVYYAIAVDILGEHQTEHQRKAIIRRKDIRATLPREMKRKR